MIGMIDEETGFVRPSEHDNYIDDNNDNNDDDSTVDDSDNNIIVTATSTATTAAAAGNHLRRHTNVSLNSSTHVSDSEYLDYFSEMSPLRRHPHQQQQHPGAVEEVVIVTTPFPVSYGSTTGMEAPPKYYNLQRMPSDESINTVAALPGMVIRCHSVSHRQRKEGTCIIRPSTTKVALKAVQSEKRKTQRVHDSTGGAAMLLPDSSTLAPELPSLTTTTTTTTTTTKENYWIDIETPQRSSEELYDFLKQLRLPSFLLSVLSEPSTWTSEVVALKQVSLAIFQILPTNPDSNDIAHVALLTMPRLLVTFSTFNQCHHSEGFYPLVYQYMKERERVPEPSNTGLLLAWLHFHVRRTARAIRRLRVATVEMDEALDNDFESFEFDNLVEAKNCLLRVLSVAEEQNKTIELLAVAEQSTDGLDFFNCMGAFSMLQANASSNERQSMRVDKHLCELRERIMSYREVTLNRRLALLTILSAIFMPLTLLSGIWGMNFENMPELQSEGAYQKALLAMLLLAMTMVVCFRRLGLLDI